MLRYDATQKRQFRDKYERACSDILRVLESTKIDYVTIHPEALKMWLSWGWLDPCYVHGCKYQLGKVPVKTP